MPPAPTNARTHTLFFQRLLRNCELCIVRAVLLRHCTSRTSMNVCVCVFECGCVFESSWKERQREPPPLAVFSSMHSQSRLEIVEVGIAAL